MTQRKPNLADVPLPLPKDDGAVGSGLIACDQAHVVEPSPAAMADHRPPSWRLAQVIVRMPREKRRRLHQVALSLDKTVQDVVLQALDEYLNTRGLRLID